MAGPWQVEKMPGVGWGVFRSGEGGARQFRPYAVFREREVALVFAAVLPGTGREPAFELSPEADGAGYAVGSGAGGEVIGYLARFDTALVAAAHAAERVVRQPASLALLLEAAGGVALERAGAILEGRVGGDGPDGAAGAEGVVECTVARTGEM